MRLIGSLLCRLGKHKRSRGHARRQGDLWVSRCRRCTIPLYRLPSGKWIATEAPFTPDP